ncbi:unnamed protein product [Jaminaea pallidilutea]
MTSKSPSVAPTPASVADRSAQLSATPGSGPSSSGAVRSTQSQTHKAGHTPLLRAVDFGIRAGATPLPSGADDALVSQGKHSRQRVDEKLRQEIEAFEANLDELERQASTFYDGLETQLCNRGSSGHTHAALTALVANLKTTLSSLGNSALGGLSLQEIKDTSVDAQQSKGLSDQATDVRSQSDHFYERRQRLREAGGAVAHVLAAGGLGTGATSTRRNDNVSIR